MRLFPLNINARIELFEREKEMRNIILVLLSILLLFLLVNENKTEGQNVNDEPEEKNIDPNHITYKTLKEIEKLLEKNDITSDDIENMQFDEKLGLSAELFLNMIEEPGRAKNGLWPLLIGEMLYELRYYVGELPSAKMTPKLKSAIKDFQSSLGYKPTGELLVKELFELMDKCGKLHPERILLPGAFFFCDEEIPDYCILKGTWVFKDGTTQAFPIQTSTIEFDKKSMSGIEAIAQISYWADSDTDPLLTSEIVKWKVTKWNSEEIVAENDRPLFVSYTLTADLTRKKVYMYRRYKGESFLKESDPSILELADGHKVAWDFHEEREKTAMQGYSPKYKSVRNNLK